MAHLLSYIFCNHFMTLAVSLSFLAPFLSLVILSIIGYYGMDSGFQTCCQSNPHGPKLCSLQSKLSSLVANRAYTPAKSSSHTAKSRRGRGMWCSLILEHGGFPIHGGIQLPPEVHHHLACWGFPSRLPERVDLFFSPFCSFPFSFSVGRFDLTMCR